MYQQCAPQSGGLSGLGFSLKPPSWITNALKVGAAAVIGATRVTVQTPVGPQVLDAGQVKKILTTAKIDTSGAATKPTNPAEAVSNVVENIPGGWLTIGGLAIGIGLLLARRK